MINEALDEGDAQKTLQALQIPAAKLEGVLAEVAQHYQDTLIRAKREKAQVSGPELFLSVQRMPSILELRQGDGRSLNDSFPWAPLDSEQWRTQCKSHRLCLPELVLFYTFDLFVGVCC